MDSQACWCRSTFGLAATGGALLWAALPPLGIAPLAWIAPVPWLVLVLRNELVGRRPYVAIYVAALVFWFGAIHWLRLPHPALYFGWLALAAYLACYLPTFVALSRVAVHGLGVPLWLAAPAVWTGLELARAHVMTGFLMGSIAHTQARWPLLIQTGDLAGEYAVDFLIVLVAASLASAIYPRRRPLALVPGGLALAAALGYGYWRLEHTGTLERGEIEQRRIALIQGNSLADWKMDAAKQTQIMDQYVSLSEQAVDRARQSGARPIDLIVWPETMFRSANRTGLVTFEEGYPLPKDIGRTTEEIVAAPRAELAALVARLGAPILVGIDRIYFPSAGAPASRDEVPGFQGFNSSVMVDGAGQIVGTYDKQHLVMFGEYVPFAKWFPLLNEISSVTGSVEAGAEPASFELHGVYYSPNICYETAIPHVIRRQVSALAGAGRTPDVLVNLTNDAWYWGSSELDMHLACGIFRAVETRTPLVIAANGGISAWIDAQGRVRAESPKQRPDVILADVELRAMQSPYVRFGDWLAGICLAACLGLACYGIWTRDQRRGRRNGQQAQLAKQDEPVLR